MGTLIEKDSDGNDVELLIEEKDEVQGEMLQFSDDDVDLVASRVRNKVVFDEKRTR